MYPLRGTQDRRISRLCSAAIFPVPQTYCPEIDMADINKPQDVRQPQAQADATIRRGAEAVQQGGHAAAYAVRQNAETGADVARRGGEAGAEAMRRAGDMATDTARRGTQAVVRANARSPRTPRSASKR
jgi:hypothetical protein